jgi:monofunctional biosynthetic peptidoglycan transglycosylase
MLKRVVESTNDKPLAYNWTPWYEMTSFPKVCAMASEDQMLPFHNGLDIAAIQDAIDDKGKKRIRGASTITQQVAKNAFLFPARSFIRKGFELYFTLLIEAVWTKRRILEVYLNIAETGDKIFGIGEAARVYFRKPAKNLTLGESALIISALPNPLKYKVASPGNYLSKRKAQVVDLYHSLDGKYYLRELYVRSEKSLYDFKKYKR